MMLTQQILDTWLKTCKMIPPGFVLNTNLLRESNEEGGWNIDLIALLCSPSDLFISWHPARAHSWCALLYLCVCICAGRGEKRDKRMKRRTDGAFEWGLQFSFSELPCVFPWRSTVFMMWTTCAVAGHVVCRCAFLGWGCSAQLLLL